MKSSIVLLVAIALTAPALSSASVKSGAAKICPNNLPGCLRVDEQQLKCDTIDHAGACAHHVRLSVVSTQALAASIPVKADCQVTFTYPDGSTRNSKLVTFLFLGDDSASSTSFATGATAVGSEAPSAASASCDMLPADDR